MKDSQENSKGEFYLKDAYYLDDDVPYRVYNGKEAENIIMPIESEELLKEAAEQTSPEQSSSSKEKKEPFSVSLLPQKVFDLIESTGETTVSLFVYAAKKLRPVFAIPAIIIFGLFKKLFLKLKGLPSHIHISLADDIKRIVLGIKAIFTVGKKLKKKKFQFIVKALYKHFLTSFTRHKHFWKTIFNLALPCAALILLVVYCNVQFNTSTLALEVIYNGESIGYVKDTDTFEKGKNNALTLLSASVQEEENGASLVSYPVYKIAKVQKNELSNSEMISEGIIEVSDENYIRACGIYIDGEFLCAVTNESDAQSVFNSILAPYKESADEDAIVGFVEEIEYIQGYYPENSTLIWDTDTLKETLSNPKAKNKHHKLREGDTLSSVAKKYGLTVKALKALNANKDLSDLSALNKLLVSQEQNYVRVKVMKTRVKKQSIPFETVERNSSVLTKGTKKTTQEGSNGIKEITELVTYINGKESYSTVVSEKVTKNPVNKIILVGTKTYSSYSYSSGAVSSSGFIWPTVGAYTISSNYGYRRLWISSSSFHSGLDIIRSGGYSSGTPIVAAASGTVVKVERISYGYGHNVIISHGNGIQTRYAHMLAGSISVSVGQYVYQGQQIGKIGSTGNSTGPHLHFEVIVNGSKVNPLNYIRR